MYQYKVSHPVFAPISAEADSKTTYSAGAFLGEAITVGLTVQENAASLFGDNRLVANVTAFKQCDLSLGVTELPLSAYKTIFGATYTAGTGDTGEKLTEKVGDTAAYGGFGFIIGGEKDGAATYQLIWLNKVKLSKPAETYNTNGESISFGTPTLSGVATADKTGEWRSREVYSNEAAALAALKAKAMMSA